MFARSNMVRLLAGCALAAFAAGGSALAQDAPIVQPGAPGQAARTLTAQDAATLAANRFSADDVRFMQDMILHHYQAVQMADLVESRTNRQGVVDAAGRIKAAQADEIAFMQRWLRERGAEAPDPAAAGSMSGMNHGSMNHGAMDHGAMNHDGHAAMSGHGTMAGMATPEQMAALAAAQGVAFDRQFLSLMIAHHEGAVEMVRHLLGRSGSAYDPVLFEFTTDVQNEQQGEIRRMTALSRQLTDDPRATLTAGFADAGQAIENLRLVASLPKPAGFFDPENPAGLPPPLPASDRPAASKASGGRDEEDPAEGFGKRSPFLSFANTDMAFSGDLMAVGSYHGYNLYRLGQGDQPQLLSSVVCPGGQGDVSIVGDLLIMSVEQTTARVDCGRQGVAEDVSAERFRGLRIFNISNPRAPVQVGQVQTCRGSHTHSVVASDERDIIVYVSGTSSIRDERELAGCVGAVPGDNRTALFSVDVVEIPIADPSRARIIDSPRVFADAASGQIAGLWQGGDHGDGTQTTSRTDPCHDITVFPSRNIAAGACSGNGLIFDISDPRHPKRIDAVNDKGFAYWHSATFNNDGTKVLFTDEWGGGSRPRCRVQDPTAWGADAFYDIVGGKLEFRSYYKLPAPQTDQENCVAHNGSIIPVPGRDLFVQAWYQGGLSVIDFTDSAHPAEIAYFDRGPINADHAILGGYWSTYWYDGRIYGTEIARGLDVFALEPSDRLSPAEIAAAALGDQGRTFNPQRQEPVTWPDHPVVAQAYVDQLRRQNALDPALLDRLTAALTQATADVAAGRKDPAVAASLAEMGRALPAAGPDAQAGRRLTALKSTLAGVSAGLN